VINLRGKQSAKTWWQKEFKMIKELGIILLNIPMNSTESILDESVAANVTYSPGIPADYMLEYVVVTNNNGEAGVDILLRRA